MLRARWFAGVLPALLLLGLGGGAPAAHAQIPLHTPVKLALNYGLFALRQQQWADAEEYFRQAIELDSLDVESHHYLGVTLLVAGCREAGLRELRTATGLRGRSAKYRIQIASDLLKMGLLPEAEEFLRDAVRVDPYEAEAYQNLVQVLFLLNRKPEALTIARLGVLGVPGDARVRFQYAQILVDLNCPEAAETVLRRVVELDPKLSGAQYQLAVLLSQRGETNGVDQILREAIKWDETMAEAHHQLGLLQMNGGQVKEAIESLKRAHDLYRVRNDSRAVQALEALIGELWKLLP